MRKVAFCWLSVGFLLAFCSHSVYFLFPFCLLSVPILFTFCSHSVYFLLPFCLLSVSILFTFCSHSVHHLLPFCSLSFPVLFTFWSFVFSLVSTHKQEKRKVLDPPKTMYLKLCTYILKSNIIDNSCGAPNKMPVCPSACNI